MYSIFFITVIYLSVGAAVRVWESKDNFQE